MIGTLGQGRYELVGELGRGGMATVYLARDARLGQPIAIKRLHPHLAGDPALRRRLRAEVVCSRKVAHPAVLKIYEYHEEPGEAYLTMEAFESVDLEAWLVARGLPSVEGALALIRPILEALSAAHGQGIVHRDLKPQNILIADELAVRVADFGLARVEELVGGATSTFFVGTPEYAAPELFGGGLFDHRADLYAVGLILYRMLAGPVPAMDASVARLLGGASDTGSRLEGMAFGAAPEWLRRVVLKLTDAQPERRFGSAREALDALDAKAAEPYGLDGAARCGRCGAARVDSAARCVVCGQEFLLARQGAGGGWVVVIHRPRNLAWTRLFRPQDHSLRFEQLQALDLALRELLDEPETLSRPEIQRALNVGVLNRSGLGLSTRNLALLDRLDQESAEAVARYLQARGLPAEAVREDAWLRFRMRHSDKIGVVIFVASIVGLSLLHIPQFAGLFGPLAATWFTMTAKILDLSSKFRLKPQPLPAKGLLAELEALAGVANAARSERLRRVVLEISAQAGETMRLLEAAEPEARAAFGDAAGSLAELLRAAAELGGAAIELEARLESLNPPALERSRQELLELGRFRQGVEEEMRRLQGQLELAEEAEERFFLAYARLVRLAEGLRQLSARLRRGTEAGHWLRQAFEELR